MGDIAPGVLSPLKLSAIIENLAATEKVEREDITIISDRGRDDPRTPGIRLDFNMKVILDFHNQHILSRDALTGLLRSFGIPRL